MTAALPDTLPISLATIVTHRQSLYHALLSSEKYVNSLNGSAVGNDLGYRLAELQTKNIYIAVDVRTT